MKSNKKLKKRKAVLIAVLGVQLIIAVIFIAPKFENMLPFVEDRTFLANGSPISMPAYIMHAGGGVFVVNDEGVWDRINYTNSRQALDYWYERGHRFFELDILLTSDGRLILLHDQLELQKYFDDTKDLATLTHAEFMGYRMGHGLRQMDLTSLVDWLVARPDAFVITDVRGNNVESLDYIQRNYGHCLHQFIPQIYNFQEYIPVSGMGYENIILTLYRINFNDRVVQGEVVSFAAKNELFAVTMPKLLGALPQKLYNRADTLTYTHTVNDLETLKKHAKYHVYGIYSDFPPKIK